MDFALKFPGITGTIAPPSGVPTGGLFTTGQDAIRAGLSFFLIIVLLLAILYALLGAIRYVFARGDQEKIKGAREKITYSIVGLIVAFLAFLFVGLFSSFVNVPFISKIAILPPPTGAPTPTPGPTSTPVPTPTLGPTATPIPTGTPVPTPTLGPTATPIPTSTPIPTGTPVPTPTFTPTPTLTPTPTNTPTPTPTPTPIPCTLSDSDGQGYTETCKDSGGPNNSIRTFKDYCDVPGQTSGFVKHFYTCNVINQLCEDNLDTDCSIFGQVCFVKPNGAPICKALTNGVNGFVWVDAGGDGVKNNEPGAVGAEIKAIKLPDNTVAATTTILDEASAYFQFLALDAGEYKISLKIPEGFKISPGTNFNECSNGQCSVNVDITAFPANVYDTFKAFGIVPL